MFFADHLSESAGHAFEGDSGFGAGSGLEVAEDVFESDPLVGLAVGAAEGVDAEFAGADGGGDLVGGA